MKFNLFTNKYVLYLLAFLSIVNILGYFINRSYGAITFFALVAFLTFCFTKNMIIVLGIALFSTNLLGSLAEIFMYSNNNSNYNTRPKMKEGFINNDVSDKNVSDKNVSDKNVSDKKQSLDIEGSITKTGGIPNFDMGLFSSFNNDNETNKDISLKFDKTQDLDNKKDFLQTQMTADNIKEIEQKTKELLNEQDTMMKQIADFGPLLSSSLEAIGNVTSGNIGGVVKQLTNNLDSLYQKYPDSFPSDYKETSEKMKGTLDQVQNEKGKVNDLLNSNKIKENPVAQQKINTLKEQLNF